MPCQSVMGEDTSCNANFPGARSPEPNRAPPHCRHIWESLLLQSPEQVDTALMEELGIKPEDIIVTDAHLRPEFPTEDPFDIVLIYCDADEQDALKFKDILEKFIILKDNKPARVCVLDRGDNLPRIQSRFAHLEAACGLSTYMFIFMTHRFVEDSWGQMQRDECLQESLENEKKKWCVVPIHTKSKRSCNYRTPWGLRALKGVFIDTMLKGRKLEDISVSQLGRNAVDPFFIKSMTDLLNERIELKQERKKEQVDLLQRERIRAYHYLLNEMIEKRLQEREQSRREQDERNRCQNEFHRRLLQVQNQDPSDGLPPPPSLTTPQRAVQPQNPIIQPQNPGLQPQSRPQNPGNQGLRPQNPGNQGLQPQNHIFQDTRPVIQIHAENVQINEPGASGHIHVFPSSTVREPDIIRTPDVPREPPPPYHDGRGQASASPKLQSNVMEPAGPQHTSSGASGSETPSIPVHVGQFSDEVPVTSMTSDPEETQVKRPH